jgi:hypothetical protein
MAEADVAKDGRCHWTKDDATDSEINMSVSCAVCVLSPHAPACLPVVCHSIRWPVAQTRSAAGPRVAVCSQPAVVSTDRLLSALLSSLRGAPSALRCSAPLLRLEPLAPRCCHGGTGLRLRLLFGGSSPRGAGRSTAVLRTCVSSPPSSGIDLRVIASHCDPVTSTSPVAGADRTFEL